MTFSMKIDIVVERYETIELRYVRKIEIDQDASISKKFGLNLLTGEWVPVVEGRYPQACFQKFSITPKRLNT